jgi:hypothetical protein
VTIVQLAFFMRFVQVLLVVVFVSDVPPCVYARVCPVILSKKLRHRAREIVWLNHVAQVAVSKMAELGIVPPYEFVADGMGRNASVELW